MIGLGLTGQVVEQNLGAIEPLLVGVCRCQLGLEFLVIDDPPRLHVDQEHLARLQPPFLDNLVLRYFQHTHFRGHQHQVIIGDQITGRSQTIAVQGGSDLPAVGKGNRSGSIPGLHQGGMIFIESTPFFIHQRIAGPGLGNQQHHGVSQRVTPGYQQFQGIVETGGIRLSLGNQGPQFLQILAQ